MKLCETYFNVESDGNCDPRKDPHGELKSQNVLTVMGTDIDQLKEDFGLDSQQLKEKIGEIQRILYAERQKRPRPHLDDKILTSWNGLMISGYAVSGMALQNPDFVKRAERAAEFLQKHMFHQENHSLLRSVYTEGSEVKQLGDPIHGFMDDYAFLIRGLLDLYEATFEAKWVEWADKLQKKQNELFWDATGNFCQKHLRKYFESGSIFSLQGMDISLLQKEMRALSSDSKKIKMEPNPLVIQSHVSIYSVWQLTLKILITNSKLAKSSMLTNLL